MGGRRPMPSTTPAPHACCSIVGSRSKQSHDLQTRPTTKAYLSAATTSSSTTRWMSTSSASTRDSCCRLPRGTGAAAEAVTASVDFAATRIGDWHAAGTGGRARGGENGDSPNRSPSRRNIAQCAPGGSRCANAIFLVASSLENKSPVTLVSYPHLLLSYSATTRILHS